MTKKTSSIPNKSLQTSPSTEPGSSLEKRQRVPLWQALALPIASILIFFLLLEGGLALFGVKPALNTEDPFVGFAANVPLFVPDPGSKDMQSMITAPNKLNFFNSQSFAREKPSGNYRIFSLGGSTTYGRPYDDSTSFSGWLREFLPVADKNKNWEVINAGGISYASYRVAHLMEELVNYQPDLFIIYTGHNEFLEERTYSKIRDIPPMIRSTVSLMAKTRTWSAMTSAMQGLGINSQAETEDRENLSTEVTAVLDHSAGMDLYTRDDPLQQNILHHYRISLERMVALAGSVNAKVIFVTPASNLKDSSPFKSEHTPGLDLAAQQRSAQTLIQAQKAIQLENWNEALKLLDKATALNPRHAELQYRRGQVLLALERFEEADIALHQARDEDVCPLRALTPMRQIVTEVAREQGVWLVDYIDLLELQMKKIKDYAIPGEELFLDHVHPTIEGNKTLAVALIQKMIDQGLVQPGADWDEQAIAAVENKIEGRIDKEAHGLALASLARVLLWAGKTEDASRLAMQALDIAGEYQEVAVNSFSILVTVYKRQGNFDNALKLLYTAIEKAPGAIEFRLKLGETLLKPPFLQLEEAAANLLLVCQQMPQYDVPFQYFGFVMARRGRTRIAYASLQEALRLNPNNTEAQKILAQISTVLKGQELRPQQINILLDIYPSLAPRKLLQVRRDSSGRQIADGIEVEFHENGRLKRFLDIDQGKPNGLEIIWDTDGRQLSRKFYRQGKPVSGRAGK